MSGRRIPAILGRGWISKNQATAHFLILMVSLGNVMVPVGVSFSLLMCFSECILRLTVYWKSTCPPSWTHLVLISLCHVLGLCHSFKCCALPPSLLFQKGMVMGPLAWAHWCELRSLSTVSTELRPKRWSDTGYIAWEPWWTLRIVTVNSPDTGKFPVRGLHWLHSPALWATLPFLRPHFSM